MQEYLIKYRAEAEQVRHSSRSASDFEVWPGCNRHHLIISICKLTKAFSSQRTGHSKETNPAESLEVEVNSGIIDVGGKGHFHAISLADSCFLIVGRGQVARTLKAL